MSTGTTTDYAGNFVYENGNLQFFNQPEGYVEPVSAGSTTFVYVYQYKDHLGNIRLSYKDISLTSTPSIQIQEENNYYPFGLKHKGYNNVQVGRDHKFGFGNKEEQDELGLAWIDITARNYDAALGRWMNLDPLAENGRRHSPYNYAFNNPIYFIDYDGMWPYGSDDPPPSYLDMVKEGWNKFWSGISGRISEATNVKREMELQSGDNQLADKATEERNEVNQKADSNIMTGTEDIVKGSSMVALDATDKTASAVSDGANVLTVASQGTTAIVTVPLAKGADFVSGVSKVGKASIHFSDGNDEAAYSEITQAVTSVALTSAANKTIKHSKKVGNIVTKNQENIQSSSFSVISSIVIKSIFGF